MKRFFTLLGFILVVSASATTIDFDGLGRVRSTSAEDYDFDKSGKDKVKQTSYRFQLGVNVIKSEKTSLYMQSRFNKIAADTTSGQSSGSLSDRDGFDVHQAFIKHKVNDLTFKLGRQELLYGDQLLIGSVPWSDIGRSFDGYKMIYNSKYGQTDFLYMTVKEIGKEVDSDRDHDLMGIYHSGSFKGVKNLDLYYLIDKDDSDKVGSNQIEVSSVGFRAKSNFKKINYRFEYTNQKVKKSSSELTGNQFDIEFGYNFGAFGLAVEFAEANENYKQLYPTGHKWFGHADLFKRQNINQVALHTKYKHSDKLNLTMSYHMLKVVDKTSSAHKWLYTATEDTSEDVLGDEIDFTATYLLEKGLIVQAGYALFSPGERFESAGSKDSLKFSYFQLISKF